MADSKEDSLDDISFYIGEDEGFCTSFSVCDSDISVSDSEGDFEDDFSLCISVSDSEGDFEDDFSLCESLESQGAQENLGACCPQSNSRLKMPLCIGENVGDEEMYISETESETDDDESDDKLVVNSAYMTIVTSASTEGAQEIVLKDTSLCSSTSSGLTSRREPSSSIPREVPQIRASCEMTENELELDELSLGTTKSQTLAESRKETTNSIAGGVLYSTFYFTALLAFVASQDSRSRRRHSYNSVDCPDSLLSNEMAVQCFEHT
ncbi:hypothetical protein ACHAWF_015899 [Thalassiosira exigua]